MHDSGTNFEIYLGLFRFFVVKETLVSIKHMGTDVVFVAEKF